MTAHLSRKILYTLSAFATTGILALVMLVGMCTLTACAIQAEDDQTSATNQVDVVVQFDDHDVVIREVGFSSPISGLAALQRSGLEVVTTETNFGPAVCSIEGVGCPAEDCFCNPVEFWNYTYWDGAQWRGYPVGASSSVISQTGAVEGWRWGEFEASQVPAYQVQSAQDGLDWIRAQQVISDGSYNQSTGGSVEALLAVGANGVDGDTWRRQPGSPSLLAYVQENASQYADDGVAEAGKLAVALNAGDGCFPTDSMNPMDYYSETLSSLSDQPGFLSWGLLGTLAIDDSVYEPDMEMTATTPVSMVANSVATLKSFAQQEGGWEWSPGWGVDTNTTALAIQVLVAAGEPISATEIISALAFLDDAQNDDGGFPYDPFSDFDTESDTNSTAYVVQALIAAGESFTQTRWMPNGNSPLDFLAARQLEDGNFEWQQGEGPNPLATYQAVTALLGKTYPFAVGGLSSCLLTSGSVTPEAGGQISATINSTQITVDFPPASASQALDVSIAQATNPYAGGKFQFLGKAFDIQAMDGDDEPVTDFDPPFTLTFRYTDADLVAAGIEAEAEAQLEFTYWDMEEEEWVTIDTTVNKDANQITAEIDHLTRFGVAIELGLGVYLPRLTR